MKKNIAFSLIEFNMIIGKRIIITNQENQGHNSAPFLVLYTNRAH